MKQKKFKVGQRVWFLKSMRMCIVVEDYGIVKPYGQCYAVKVMDSDKRLFVPEQGLQLCEGEDATTDNENR